MSRPREHNPVSLFPFLAVLVCAMGALILLLLVTTRRIRSEALARAWEAAQSAGAQAEPEPPRPTRPTEPVIAPADSSAHTPPELTGQTTPGSGSIASAADPPDPSVAAPRPPPRPIDPNPALRARIAALARERDQRRQELAALDTAWEAAQRRADALHTRLAGTDGNLHDLRAQRDRARRSVAALEEQQRRLAAQIHEVDRRVARASQQQAVAPSKFVIVPYDGMSGTNRRPILIEFTGEGIRFIPENVLLRKEDFEGFTPGYNPLLAGARVLIDYWSEQSRRAGGDEPPPYVLLIVRPSGVPYYPLRLLLERLGEPFGYELLGEDQELALPDVDPAAAEACRLTIERMLQQRDRLMQLVQLGREAGFGDPEGDAGWGAWPADDLDPGATGRAGQTGGAGQTGRAGQDASRMGTGSAETGPSGERRGPVFRGNQRPSYDLVEPDSGIVLPRRQPGPRVVQLPGRRRAGGPGAVVEGHSSFGSGTRQNAGATPAGIGHGTGESATAQSTGDTGPGGADGPPGAGDSAASIIPGIASVESGGEPSGGMLPIVSPAPSSRPGSGWLPYQTADRRPAGAGQSAAGGDGNDAQARGNEGLPGDPRGPAGSATGAVGRNATTGRAQPTDGSPRTLAASDAAPSGGSGGSGPASSSGQGSTPDGGAGQPVFMPPSLSLPTYHVRNSPFSESRPHRRRWGLSSPRATIGFERDVRIDATADGLLIDGDQTIAVADGESREALVRRTLEGIEAVVQSWGWPPESFYWIPSLKFRVAPGGNQHYERLRGGLQEWGLPVAATYTLESTPLAPRVEAAETGASGSQATGPDAATRGAGRLLFGERIAP